jgi:hypothetical protein
VYARGDAHGWNVPVAAPGPSSLHSNVAPNSVAEKVNEGPLLPVMLEGPLFIVVSGGVASTVNAPLVVPSLPAASVARTQNV